MGPGGDLRDRIVIWDRGEDNLDGLGELARRVVPAQPVVYELLGAGLLLASPWTV
jgi:hypothetical protein